MRGLITLLLLTLASLANAAQPQQFIDIQHDTHRGVTCWIVNGTSISCLPDSQLNGKPNQTSATDQDQLTPASTPTPRSHEEIFQL